jgi:hypothetical protein
MYSSFFSLRCLTASVPLTTNDQTGVTDSPQTRILLETYNKYLKSQAENNFINQTEILISTATQWVFTGGKRKVQPISRFYIIAMYGLII